MEVDILSNVMFFKLYPVGREAKRWGIIGAFRSLKSQSTAKIFLACELMGGIHNALVTQIPPTQLQKKITIVLLKVILFTKPILSALQFQGPKSNMHVHSHLVNK
jgi:hypothetical protein